jgi:CheY-like chemotaxis protein
MEKNFSVKPESIIRGAVLDDNQDDLILILRALNSRGVQHNLAFDGSTSPDEVYELATKDNSVWVVISDVFLRGLSSEEKLKVRDGTEFAVKVFEKRGRSIDYVLMTGDQMLADMLQNVGMLQESPAVATWNKSADFDRLYERVYSGIAKRNPPTYPRVFIVTGPYGAGKSSSAGHLKNELSWFQAFTAATTRARRASEIDYEKKIPLFRRLEHEFLSRKSLVERMEAAQSPLLWTHNSVVTKNSPDLDRILKNEELYLLDLAEVKKSHKEGSNVMIITPVISVVSYLKDYFGLLSHTIVLNAGEKSRLERVSADGRTSLETNKRLSLEDGLRAEEITDKMYVSLCDSVINTELEISYASDPEIRRQEAANHVSNRVKQIIMSVSKKPYNVPSNKIQQAYVDSIESTLASLAGTKTIDIGTNIVMDQNVLQRYHLNNPKASENLLNLIMNVYESKISDIQVNDSVKSIHLEPSGSNVSGGEENKVLMGIYKEFLSEQGYLAAEHNGIYPFKDLLKFMPNKLVYALSDVGPKIELIF